ncbi:hypothetical protein GUF79_18560 [Xanthomonas citri pv. citri]|nr:hypothetical protein [Xanthomonas citri pv. citri]
MSTIFGDLDKIKRSDFVRNLQNQTACLFVAYARQILFYSVYSVFSVVQNNI